MMLNKNYNLISLYSAVFIIIALTTAYLPLWLKESLNFGADEIGFLLAFIGIFKFYSNLIIIKRVKNTNNIKNTMIFLTISIIFLFFIITYFQGFISKKFNIFFISISLLMFSPIIPMVETIFNHSQYKFEKHYGRIRLSGSLSFLITVYMASIFFDKFYIKSYPILFLACLIILLINIFFLKKERNFLEIVNYKNDFKKIMKHKEYLLILIICSLIQSSHAMYYSYSTILWKSIGLSLIDIGKLWSIGVISEIFLFYKISRFDIKKNFFLLLSLCGFLSAIRWMATLTLDNFYFLIFIQLLHAVSFGLTHYLMMYFISNKIPNRLKLIAQVLYHGLSGGIMLTFFILCLSFYFKSFYDNKGYILMAVICILGFILSFFANRKGAYENNKKI